jgi:hypothetical protein
MPARGGSMSENKRWLERNGSAVIAVLMLGGLVVVLLLNMN